MQRLGFIQLVFTYGLCMNNHIPPIKRWILACGFLNGIEILINCGIAIGMR